MTRASVARSVQGRAPVLVGDVNAHASAHNVQTIIDQQGTGRVIHKPDGSIVWEPLPDDRSNAGCDIAKKAMELMELAVKVTLVMSGAIAAASTAQQVDNAYKQGISLSSGQLTRAVGHTVASSIAGMMAGMVLGPVRAATHVASAVARPAIGGLLIYRGVVWIRRHCSGTVGLIRALQSGKIWKQLEALRCIASRAMKNETFRNDFARFSGVELLLKLLSDALNEAAMAGPGVLPAGAAAAGLPLLLQRLAQALEALLRSQECRDICVGAGGVPIVTELLRVAATAQHTAASVSRPASPRRLRRSSSNSSFSSYGSGASSLLLDNFSCAGSGFKVGSTCRPTAAYGSSGGDAAALTGSALLTQLAMECLSHLASRISALDAIRESGGLSVIVEVLSTHAPCSPLALQAVTLLQDLSVDSAAKDAIGRAGGVQVLLEVIKVAVPKSEVQAAAIATLHMLLRGSRANQEVLAHLPGSFMYLHSCHASLGASWHPCKADLDDMFNILSRFPQDMPCHNTGAAVSRKVMPPKTKHSLPEPGHEGLPGNRHAGPPQPRHKAQGMPETTAAPAAPAPRSSTSGASEASSASGTAVPACVATDGAAAGLQQELGAGPLPVSGDGQEVPVAGQGQGQANPASRNKKLLSRGVIALGPHDQASM